MHLSFHIFWDQIYASLFSHVFFLMYCFLRDHFALQNFILLRWCLHIHLKKHVNVGSITKFLWSTINLVMGGCNYLIGSDVEQILLTLLFRSHCLDANKLPIELSFCSYTSDSIRIFSNIIWVVKIEEIIVFFVILSDSRLYI